MALSGQAVANWRNRQLAMLQNLKDKQKAQALMVDLDWLLREVTGLDRLALRLGLFQSCPSLNCTKSLAELDDLWHDRVSRDVPLQYLLGYTAWRHFRLKVSPAVLIPRPETEAMIDWVAATISEQPGLEFGVWLDLGTGSGAIALGLADLLPKATIHAVDKSPEALAVAQQNAEDLGLSDRIQFWQGSWFEPFPHQAGSVSGICSNPPYIPTEMIQTLQPEILCHEPHLALDGGTNGLHEIQSLIQQAQFYLRSQGFLLIECMAGQGNAIAALMADHNYERIQVHPDLAGLDRFVQGFKP